MFHASPLPHPTAQYSRITHAGHAFLPNPGTGKNAQLMVSCGQQSREARWSVKSSWCGIPGIPGQLLAPGEFTTGPPGLTRPAVWATGAPGLNRAAHPGAGHGKIVG